MRSRPWQCQSPTYRMRQGHEERPRSRSFSSIPTMPTPITISHRVAALAPVRPSLARAAVPEPAPAPPTTAAATPRAQTSPSGTTNDGAPAVGRERTKCGSERPCGGRECGSSIYAVGRMGMMGGGAASHQGTGWLRMTLAGRTGRLTVGSRGAALGWTIAPLHVRALAKQSREFRVWGS
jgi:hypothetical protein